MTANVRGLPATLQNLVDKVNTDASKAMDRLAAAADANSAAVEKVNDVSAQIEAATKQTEDLLAKMAGDNGAPAGGG